jgi:hypothetical protein
MQSDFKIVILISYDVFVQQLNFVKIFASQNAQALAEKVSPKCTGPLKMHQIVYRLSLVSKKRIRG